MMTMIMTRTHISLFTLLFLICTVFTLPTDLSKRTEPYFPPEPPSCLKCEADYSDIQHCAAAAPVLANFTMVLFNPGAFIDVIQCACTETFQAVFPQCVDCFIRTNQTEVLDCTTEELPEALKGVRSICGTTSTIFGNVSVVNSLPTPTLVPDPNGAFRNTVGTHLTTLTAILATIMVLS